MTKFFAGSTEFTGLVIYAAPLFMYNTPSWCVWIIPGYDEIFE